MTEPPRVLSERRGTVHLLTLNRPDTLNAADVLGTPGLVAACAAERRDDDVIEAMLSSATAPHDSRALAGRLQTAGVEAFPVLTPPDLVADAHLAARGFFVDVPVGGRTVRLPGSPLHGLADPVGPAPRFGEHTAGIVDVLGDTANPRPR